jgi:hypothetical protein
LKQKETVMVLMFAETEVNDLDIQALADNELPPPRRRHVMDHVMKSPVLLRRLEELLRQRNHLRQMMDRRKH